MLAFSPIKRAAPGLLASFKANERSVRTVNLPKCKPNSAFLQKMIFLNVSCGKILTNLFKF